MSALAVHFEISVAWGEERHPESVAWAAREGLRLSPLGRIEDDAEGVRARLGEAVAVASPDVIHLLYDGADRLTLMTRDLAEHALVVYECRDPLTTLVKARAGDAADELERSALRASHAQIVVTEAVRDYYERRHGLDLRESALVVPHGFARRTTAAPASKLSRTDGRLHVALVGTAEAERGSGRFYGDIISRLLDVGVVVHSHFHEIDGAPLEAYRALAAERADYHLHPTVSFRDGTALSELVSRYDLMGVFHELAAPLHNEAATLAVCLPTKAVCGWHHGGIPVVCLPHYRGVVEWIEAFGIGFVVDRIEDVARLDRAAIAAATDRCLAHRHAFTNEWNAERIHRFFEERLAIPRGGG